MFTNTDYMFMDFWPVFDVPSTQIIYNLICIHIYISYFDLFYSYFREFRS